MESKLKATAYLCSYKGSKTESLHDLDTQKTKIEAFCDKKNIDIDVFLTEQNSSRNDYKPVLLQILNQILQTSDKLIVLNPESLSEDDDLRIWVRQELEQIGIDVIYVVESKKDILKAEEHISKKALRIKGRVKSIPSLPVVVTRVLQLVQDEKTSSAKLSKAVFQDSGLTARVLRLANSSFYGFSRPIGSVQDAITLLGHKTVKRIAKSSSVFKILPTKNISKNIFDYQFFWKHNLLTAIGAKHLSELLNIDKTDSIFSAAILHNIGQIILALYDYKDYALAYMRIFGNFDSVKSLQIEEYFSGINHCEIGHLLADSWNLPDEILDVILYHHTPNSSEHYKLSCLIVHVADILANFVLFDLPLDFKLFDFYLLEKFDINKKLISSTYDKLIEENININDIENFFNKDL